MRALILALLLVAATPSAAAEPDRPLSQTDPGPAAGATSPAGVAPAPQPPTPAEVPPAVPTSPQVAAADIAPEPPITDHWAELARCESGNWLDGGASFAGPIRWDWGADLEQLPPWASIIDRGSGPEAQFHGGLQHHPDTWAWVAGDLGLLGQYPAAYDAPAHVQVQVATEVRARQGWEAWPVCSRRVGLR